jgi:hypothetical protein
MRTMVMMIGNKIILTDNIPVFMIIKYKKKSLVRD